jgi:hypothetical protein
MTDSPQGILDLDRDALLAELERAHSALEDTEEMRRFTLGQTGVHIGMRQLKAMQTTWMRDEERLRTRIAAIEALLARLPAE